MKKNSRGYWEYDPVIYPRKLWVAIGLSTDDLKNTFTPIDGSEWVSPDKDFDGVTFSEMARRDNNKYGEFVLFNAKKDMTMNICTHEASHVCDAIEEAIGMKHGDEPSAYLLGWIASRINMARLGIGEFITIKKENQMNNYKLKIDKNSWDSIDIIKTIQSINLVQLSNDLHSKLLCERKTLCQVYESGSFYQEYDEFYFQAENCVEALDIGMGLYKKPGDKKLSRINKYALYLFVEGVIDYDVALKLNENDAYEQYDKFRKKEYHISFKMAKELKVWFFDTAGSCVYGQAIVAAKDKDEAIKTLMDYTKQNGQSIRNFCLDPTMSTELKPTLVEPKVIEAWYEEC